MWRSAVSSRRPLIGVLLDYQDAGTFSTRPHYAIRTAYFDAVYAAGGLPVGVPYIAAAIAETIEHCDALVTPGGSYPFPADWYGDAPDSTIAPSPRFAFETALTEAALAADLPLLGICAGMQVIAGVFGGRFYRDVAVEPGTEIDHLNEKPAEQTAHDVAITPGSRLREIVGRDVMAVNTAHREALKAAPEGIVVNAVSTDGLIEGVEVPARKFCVGVQWHPEFFATDGDPNLELFRALIAAAADG